MTRIAWILREHPFEGTSGAGRWLMSLLESADAYGCQSQVFLPSATEIPLVSRVAAMTTEWVSPGAVTVGGLRLARPGPAAHRLMWLAYSHAPHRLQQMVAAARRARRRRSGRDHVLGRDWTATEMSWIARRVGDYAPDVVIFDSPFALAPVPGNAKRILLAPDILHERAASFAQIGYRTSPGWVTREWERDRLEDVDAIVAIQWDDARTFATMLPTTTVTVAPPAFAAAAGVAATADPEPAPVANRCLFVGNGTAHNVDGLNWLVSEVWPAVRERIPQAELRVVGAVASQVTGGAPGVDLVGMVDNLDLEYSEASLALVPLRAGSGVKVKMVEAISHGRASVSTSVGIQGLSGVLPAPFLVADSVVAFADAIVEVLSSDTRRRELEEAARSSRHAFDPATAHAGFTALLQAR